MGACVDTRQNLSNNIKLNLDVFSIQEKSATSTAQLVKNNHPLSIQTNSGDASPVKKTNNSGVETSSCSDKQDNEEQSEEEQEMDEDERRFREENKAVIFSPGKRGASHVQSKVNVVRRSPSKCQQKIPQALDIEDVTISGIGCKIDMDYVLPRSRAGPMVSPYVQYGTYEI